MRIPRKLKPVEGVAATHVAFNDWLHERALRHIGRFGRRHEAGLGVEAKAFRLSDAKSRWGSCGRDGIVRVHRRLAQGPAAAMEYVAAHEIAHLVHRNHGRAFWATAARTIPTGRSGRPCSNAGKAITVPGDAGSGG